MRILVAEDNSLTMMGIVVMLENMGHEVAATAVNGDDACRKILESKVDLALLDINMPKMSGMEVLERIRQVREVPCIFLTAYSDESFIKEASRLGAVGYIMKPVTEEQLRAQIEISASQDRRLREASASAAY